MSRRKSRDYSELSGDEGRPDIWQRLSRLLMLLVFLLVMAGILSLFLPEVERREQLDADIAMLTEERNETLDRKNRLAARLEWMRTDPEYLETVARDRLDLHRPGEFVIRVEDLRTKSDGPAEAPEPGTVPVLPATVIGP